MSVLIPAAVLVGAASAPVIFVACHRVLPPSGRPEKAEALEGALRDK